MATDELDKIETENNFKGNFAESAVESQPMAAPEDPAREVDTPEYEDPDIAAIAAMIAAAPAPAAAPSAPSAPSATPGTPAPADAAPATAVVDDEFAWFELPSADKVAPSRWHLGKAKGKPISGTPATTATPAPRRAASQGRRAAGFAVALLIGAAASLILLVAVAFGISSSNANHVLPGVHVGTVDVAGLTRDQMIDKLRSSYAYLGQGEITVTTPLGSTKITYGDAGRGPDLEAMADAAMSIGHSGNPIGDAITSVKSSMGGETVPVVVRIDPTVLAERIRPLTGTTKIYPRNATVTSAGGEFLIAKSATGHGIDERAIATEIIDRLSKADAPATVNAGGTFVTLQPEIDDKDAADSVAEAQKMVVGVSLVWDQTAADASASASPAAVASPGQSAATPKAFAIDAQTIRSWIVFGWRADGTYGPTLDQARVQSYLATIATKLQTPPVEPNVVYDAAGKPTSLTAGKNGLGVDVPATTSALQAHLIGVATGSTSGSTVTIVTTPIAPKLTMDSLTNLTVIGQGQWTTTFFPDISNGNGANIRVPATILNGQVVAPGQQFSFLGFVGPIDFAHGFTMGGVIQGGKSDHTGAIGGGICSASTTMFNAAMRAGLQIDERHAHFYYINRYPVGLDATVYSNGYETWDMKWTNDTPNPIIIRSWTTRGSKSTITVQLWSLPLDRHVELSPEYKANVTYAKDLKQYVTTLAPGKTARAEYPSNGYTTSRTRTVTDSAGNVIHKDTWSSHYGRVDGILQIGVAGPPAPTP